MLFQKDLLSGVKGELVENKCKGGKVENASDAVEKWVKVLAYACIFLLNGFLLLYVLLFALNQSASRQSAWLQSFLLWLVLEVFVVSTGCMVLSEFIMPLIMFSEVWTIKKKMVGMIHQYKEKIEQSCDGDENAIDFDDAATNQQAFNACGYK